jgi:hypothetical protein
VGKAVLVYVLVSLEDGLKDLVQTVSLSEVLLNVLCGLGLVLVLAGVELLNLDHAVG